MIRFNVIDAPDQQFGTILNRRRVTLRLRYNPSSDSWSFDLSIDNLPVLHGQRIVIGVNLLGSYDFGIGQIFAWPAVPGSRPDRVNLPNGNVRLYHVTDDEAEAAMSEAA